MNDIKNPEALAVSRLAQDLAQAYYSFLAIIQISKNPKSNELIPDIVPGQSVPVGFVRNKDGRAYHTFHFEYYLKETRLNSFTANQIEMVWPMGAFLTLGDALKKNDYFDHHPILELTYHLRNGIAHRNKFEINQKRLKEFPAHNKLVQTNPNLILEITPALQGQTVLFDFLAAGDIITLFTNISMQLHSIAYGFK